MSALFLQFRKLISIPKRIYNYINFNFERICYGSIVKIYTLRECSCSRIRHSVHYVDVQINENQYVKKARISFINYLDVKNGDTIIIASFDGYNIHAIPINIE